ncbi:MAG: hypothetical protein JW910_09305, partial [Anaerolineae bacterium]|nr:hypothetical protein [Anaerolineae bacterium]
MEVLADRRVVAGKTSCPQLWQISSPSRFSAPQFAHFIVSSPIDKFLQSLIGLPCTVQSILRLARGSGQSIVTVARGPDRMIRAPQVVKTGRVLRLEEPPRYA